ncbi:MAG: lipopolysaccharide biosynthesis protein [Agathobacter sp.]|nr:lipopolysaccharide biosynthesis protein [Agathobacter sp.]
MENKLLKGLIWKFLERFGVQGVQFVLQIILARLLSPQHYGVLSIMVIFVALANVFIQNGFNTALVQDKNVSEEDYSSVFWIMAIVATILYGLLFVSAPLIGHFYNMPSIVVPFRVIALMLFPGVINSIQLAKTSRALDFKKVFYGNIGGILVSGIVGIILAYFGAGIWALVFQTLLNVTISTCVMWFMVHWRPKLYCDLKRVAKLFSFGWKLLVSSLIDTLYQDLSSLIIGKKFSSGTLGYYNRGKQFPQFVITAISSTVQSVMLPAMAEHQDEKANVKYLMRNSIIMSSYLVFPMMAGLIGVASTLISLLLTDVWLPSVPFLQIFCISMAFYPVHMCNLQAINAMGRSDIFLKLEIIKKSIGIMALMVAVFFFETPIAIAMTGVFTMVTSCFINAYPNKKLIDYSYFEQIRDYLPALIVSTVMCLAVYCVGYIECALIVKLLLQIILGVVVYIVLSILFQLKGFKMLLTVLKGFRN